MDTEPFEPMQARSFAFLAMSLHSLETDSRATEKSPLWLQSEMRCG